MERDPDPLNNERWAGDFINDIPWENLMDELLDEPIHVLSIGSIEGGWSP